MSATVTHSPEGLRAAGEKHFNRGQMITSQEGRAQLGQVALAKEGSGKARGSWSQHCWDYPCCHSLAAPCHIPVFSFPVRGMGDATQEAPGLFCLCFCKATILVLYSVPTYCGHRLGSCLCRLLGNLESRFSGVWPGALLARHWYPSSDQIPSPGEILVSMAMHSVTTSLSAGS